MMPSGKTNQAAVALSFLLATRRGLIMVNCGFFGSQPGIGGRAFPGIGAMVQTARPGRILSAIRAAAPIGGGLVVLLMVLSYCLSPGSGQDIRHYPIVSRLLFG